MKTELLKIGDIHAVLGQDSGSTRPQWHKLTVDMAPRAGRALLRRAAGGAARKVNLQWGKCSACKSRPKQTDQEMPIEAVATEVNSRRNC